ncbi:MAG TPA: phosphatase PAP2 family protein [Cyclobacteriaceae bacterium]|nr:phosphatase PAP2 family protein [Cyclobacteriaceae bacterium]
MQTLIDLDKKLLLFLNGLNNPFMDQIMFYATKTFFWLPLYLFLIFLIFKNYRKETLFVLLGAAITIILADQITSSLMKPFFARLRPSQEPSLQGLVHLVNGYKGGLYGFASSHAANTFGTAIFVWLVLKRFYKGVAWIFIWAAFMTYTRIYLGVHYPGDILVGTIIGLSCGWIGYRIVRWSINKSEKAQSTSK